MTMLTTSLTPPATTPPIAGREAAIQVLTSHGQPVALANTPLNLATIRSAFACALHMHQPTIPAGREGALISHLQWMLEHPGEGDNHNAEPFAQCYRRLADLMPQLIHEGCNPRIMLDYSGNLLWGIEQMGRADILEALRFLACDPVMETHVEWLGTFWSHAVAPSTPIPDLRLQILAWQHHFAALFGDQALARVKGFSAPEMALPNHPDTLFEFVRALRECGYRWLLVQEHSVETRDGSPLSRDQALVPNRLVARNSQGETVSITALIKTQGSDTKLVGQMQPCYEALGLERVELGGQRIPPLVAQIADGENGGVMMNEFPQAFLQAHRRLRDQAVGDGEQPTTVSVNGSEYLELLEASGVNLDDLPEIQAVQQHRIWERIDGSSDTARTGIGRTGIGSAESGETDHHAVHPASATLADVIRAIQASDPSFSMTGASWTNNLSWVEGYANVLEPMQQLSARFHQRFDALVAEDASTTSTPEYQQALLHLLLLETSCFRYWGQGVWTEYARELHRRGMALLD